MKCRLLNSRVFNMPWENTILLAKAGRGEDTRGFSTTDILFCQTLAFGGLRLSDLG